jgi:hypothetical protein
MQSDDFMHDAPDFELEALIKRVRRPELVQENTVASLGSLIRWNN